MTFLIFGNNGQLATDLKIVAQSQGLSAHAVGRAACDLSRSVEKVQTDARRLVDELQPSILINAAAYTAVDNAERDREAALHLNGEIPGTLARIASEAGIPFVHFSTDYVFDGMKKSPWIESDATRPLSFYGESKRAGERAVFETAGTAARYVFRTSWIYGLHGANFFKTIVRLARANEELRIVDDQHGAPTSSLALARAVVRACEMLTTQPSARALPCSGVYHLSAAGETTWHGFASRIVDCLRSRETIPCRSVRAITTPEFPLPAARPANSVLSNDAFRGAFGFSLPSWERQFDEIWQAFLAHERGAFQAWTR